jgi:hypothetical protein
MLATATESMGRDETIDWPTGKFGGPEMSAFGGEGILVWE